MPLNIDWQQILLHWMNLAILTGGLYLLLYKPVKNFITKREEHYRQMDEQAAHQLEEAERVRAEYQAKLESAEEEIRQSRAKAQRAAQQEREVQLAQAKEEAHQIVARAHLEAERSRDRVMRDSKRELRKLAVQATQKMAFKADPFDQFLDLAEEGEENEK